MNNVIGIAWYKDEHTYRRALAIFIDSGNMPATYEEWKALVGRQREEVKRVAVSLFGQTSILRHLPSGATVMDLRQIRKAERPSSITSRSSI